MDTTVTLGKYFDRAICRIYIEVTKITNQMKSLNWIGNIFVEIYNHNPRILL